MFRFRFRESLEFRSKLPMGHEPTSVAHELHERAFYDLLARCQELSPGRKFRFKNRLLRLDSTIVDLCASVFDWARWRQAKGTLKLHLVLDHDGYLPCFGLVTEGAVSDVRVAQALHFPKGSIVVMDRGYTAYDLFTRWSSEGVHFVTRQKTNADCTMVESRPVPATGTVRRDETIRLKAFVAGRPNYEVVPKRWTRDRGI